MAGLGRSEDDETAAAFELIERGPALGRAQSAVEHDNWDAASPEGSLLVRHEGDEGRDDDRWPLKDHRRNLIDQRLPKAGRERHQHVASIENGEHRRFLLGAEAVDPERPARRAPARIEQAHDMASQRQHGFNPNDAAALAAGETKTSLISFSEPTLLLGTP
jgi:hypothetical protein